MGIPTPLTTERPSLSLSTSTILSESTTTCASQTPAHVLQPPRPLTGSQLAHVLPPISLPLELPTLPTLNVSEMLTTVVELFPLIPLTSKSSRSSPRTSSTSPTSRPSSSGLSSSRTSTTAPVFADHPSGIGANPLKRASQLNHALPPSRTTSLVPSLASVSSLSFQVF